MTVSKQRRLSEIEAETEGLFRRLRATRNEVPLPGRYLVVETGGAAGLLPASAVREIVRVVEFQPVVGADPAVLGTFLYRGTAAVALRFGAPHQYALDAHVVILEGAQLTGLVVDRVQAVVDEVRLAESDEAPPPGALSLCRVGSKVLPLLAVSRLVEAARPASEVA